MVLTALGLAALAGPALPADREVGISGFRFSPDEVQVDPGDTVTWRYNGPDTNHSVTSQPPGQAEEFDSDPGRMPRNEDHPIGTSFKHTFTKSGTFTYFCKVHPSMRGRVIVSGAPAGGPPPPADGTPPLGGDSEPPRVTALRARPEAICPRRTRRCRTTGASLRLTLSEDAGLKVRIERAGRQVRSVELSARAGRRSVRLAGRGLRPGRYRVSVVATDAAGNRSQAATTRLTVRSP